MNNTTADETVNTSSEENDERLAAVFAMEDEADELRDAGQALLAKATRLYKVAELSRLAIAAGLTDD